MQLCHLAFGLPLSLALALRLANGMLTRLVLGTLITWCCHLDRKMYFIYYLNLHIWLLQMCLHIMFHHYRWAFAATPIRLYSIVFCDMIFFICTKSVDVHVLDTNNHLSVNYFQQNIHIVDLFTMHFDKLNPFYIRS